jgi:hypothetical protein
VADLLRAHGAVLHAGRAALPGARRARRGPDRTPRERALPVPGRQPRAADPAAVGRPRQGRPAPVPRPLRHLARRGQHAVQQVRPVRQLRRLPLPRARQVGRRGDRRQAGDRAPECHPGHRRRGGGAAVQRGGHGRDRGRGPARRSARDVPRRPRGRLLRRREQRQAAARVRVRQAPARARERLRPGRAQLHVPQQPGRARAIEGREPHHLPEDPRGQRLLLQRRARLRVSAGQHPDGRQVAGADVPRREARRDPLRSDLEPGEGRPPRRRLLALHRRPAAAREPRHAQQGRQDPDQLHGQQRGVQGPPVPPAQGDAEGPRHAPRAPAPPPRLPQERDSRRRLCPPGRHLPVRGRPRDIRPERGLPRARARQPVRRRHQLRSQHRRRNPPLTAMANALRVGHHLLERMGARSAADPASEVAS